MRDGQNAVLESLRRAQSFLDDNSDALKAVNASTRKQLDDVETQLSELSVTQDIGARGSKGETSRKHSLRQALRQNYMTPIAELAKLNLRDVPEFASLTLPPSSITPQREIAAASSMADAAEAHKQTFIDNGLPPTFLDDLRTAAAAVTESLAGRSKHLNRRAGATMGLIAAEKRGRTMLRVLNALIKAHIGSNPELIGQWNSAKMVRRKPGPAAGHATNPPIPIHSTGGVTPAPVLTTNPTPVDAPVGVAA
ncbi:MAG TPA: hypothetical protein VK636_12200 [Gemmatimonadaceae bacterium]|nr:hypothetical protein [Gemmatimonadaceae bacterium]